jgi:glucose-1-phosphate thymidylyltransferase
LTKAVNKHLLPIAGRPMVTYALEALASGGVAEVAVVTGVEHVRAFETLLSDGLEHPALAIEILAQARPGGIAEALGLAEAFVDDHPVVVVLADNIFEYSVAHAIATFRRAPSGAQLLLAKLDQEADLSEVGVAEIDSDGKILNIVEKPADPPSQFAVTGLYCYDARVFKILPTLKRSARGELEITDVNAAYLAGDAVTYELLPGYWGDAGQSISQYYEVCDFVRRVGANRPITATAAAAQNRLRLMRQSAGGIDL